MSTPEDDEVTRAFEAQRPRLVRLAYATTGSLAEAEDCVQEAWLRLQRAGERAEIRNLGAWLTTTVSRIALDTLTSARARRERYVGQWLPEPLVEDLDAHDPAELVATDESVSMALLLVLERLTPAERTSFLLHDVFGLSFEEVAEVVRRTPASVRQLASRARRHVQDGRPRFPPTQGEQRRLVEAFVDACQQGDLAGLVALLDPEVVFRGDGGGKVAAWPRPEHGADRVARRLIGYLTLPDLGMRFAEVSGGPGIVMRDPWGVLTVIAFTVDAGRIVAIDAVRNPDKLTGVRGPE